jgi:exosortase/archaeosortase family protein
MKVKVIAKGKQQTNESPQTAEKPTTTEKPLALDFSKITAEEKTFLIRFLIAFAALFIVATPLPLTPLLEWIAHTEADWLIFSGMLAYSDGAVVHAGGIAFEIVNECSSLVMIALLASLLIAGGAKSDWKALAIGIPVLFAFNLLRLFATMWVGATYGEAALDTIHYLLWLVDSAFVLGLWIAFGRKKQDTNAEQ